MPTIPMQSMELDDENKIDLAAPITMEKPDYPWGLRGCLTNPEIEKLGVDPEDARVGESFMMQALCKVTSVSCEDRGDEKCYRIEFQICDMGILGSDEPDDDDKPRVSLGAY